MNKMKSVKITEILKSRNFQAAILALLILVFKTFGVVLPEDDALTYLEGINQFIDLFMLYILTPVLSAISKIREGAGFKWTKNMTNQLFTIVSVVVGLFFGEELAGIILAVLSNLATIIFYSRQPANVELTVEPVQTIQA